MAIDLTGRVAIVTGAGGGLGRAHALLLATRGAKIVVNDRGGARDGRGGGSATADAVVDEIRRAGGSAIANGADVSDEADVGAMIEQAMTEWGRVDILVNNAGILRDKTFAKIDFADFRAVIEVHLIGSSLCTKAVWPIMQAQGQGRIVMTTSSSGLWGNFGQSAYGAAKLGLVGLMNTLKDEGARHNIRVNCLAPSAATRMTSDIMPDDELAALDPAFVAPAMLALVADDAPTGVILCAGAGSVEAAYIAMTPGIFVGDGADASDRILAELGRITDPTGAFVPTTGMEQPRYEQTRRAEALSQTLAS